MRIDSTSQASTQSQLPKSASRFHSNSLKQVSFALYLLHTELTIATTAIRSSATVWRVAGHVNDDHRWGRGGLRRGNRKHYLSIETDINNAARNKCNFVKLQSID